MASWLNGCHVIALTSMASWLNGCRVIADPFDKQRLVITFEVPGANITNCRLASTVDERMGSTSGIKTTNPQPCKLEPHTHADYAMLSRPPTT